MYVNARDGIGAHRHLRIVDVDGNTLGMVFAANTDERWYDYYVVEPIDPPVVIDGVTHSRKLKVERKENVAFKLVDRMTGEVVAESQ